MRLSTRAWKVGILFLLFLTAAVLAFAARDEQEGKEFSALEKAYYLSANEVAYIRPGLKFEALDVTIPADRRPVVTIKITDASNQPLDRTGVLTPGTVSVSFVLAYLPRSSTDITPYTAYTTRAATGAVSGTTKQAGTDSGGSWTTVSDGVYTYRFGTALPANYDAAATHTLGFYGSRNLTEFGLSLYSTDGIKNFVPNGSPVTQIREIALTDSCNKCHDPLAAHGTGGRKSVEVCILCHSPQTIDPDTGQTMDMKVLIHKIHRGQSLPSVVAGTPYVIIGHGEADFSHVAFPQDIRNCDTCHEKSKQTNAWKLFPSIEACGSCHDDVNFTTGENHVAGPADNSQCSSCHQPQGQYEYDPSVMGAHTVPYKSSQLLYPKLNIISITNTAPGQNPTVRFKITDKAGAAMDPARFGGSLGRLSANLAGPTTDYTTRTTETISGATYANGEGTYTFKTIKIPANATGSWALQFEGRLTTTIVKNNDPSDTISQRDAMDNVVKYFSVDGSPVVPRRTVVLLANCNKCHDKLQLHGGNRNTVESCLVCHNPTLTGGSNPAGTSESLSLQYMVHKIHTGEELENDYFIGTSTNFKEVLYPGDRRNCNACHDGDTFTAPLPGGNAPVLTPKNFWSPSMPTATACMSCHDSASTAAHVFLNTATFGTTQVEACAVCHKESADFAVTKAHAR